MKKANLPILGLIAVTIQTGCEKSSPVDELARSQLQNINKMASECEQFEAENLRLEAKIIELETQLEKAESRMKIAQDSCKLYEALLDDSNSAKLERARKMIRGLKGE